jgi:ATP-dependent Lon protease
MTDQKTRRAVEPGSRDTYAVLPLRDIVVFPHMIVPLFVGREKSIRALEEVVKSDRHILLATQMNATDDEPATDTIYGVGTLASVLQLLKLPDGTVKVLVEGATRAKITGYTANEDYFEAKAEALADAQGDLVEAEALSRSGRVRVRELREAQQEGLAGGRLGRDADRRSVEAGRHDRFAPCREDLRQAGDPGNPDGCPAAREGARPDGERDLVLQVEKRIRTRVKRQMEKTQREYYLNEQMKAIQKELGDEDGKDELAELEERIEKTRLSKEARDKARGELKKLRQMSPMSAEATVVRNYLDWLLGIRGASVPRSRRICSAPRRRSTTIISAWRRSRIGLSSTWPCSSAPTS